MKLVLKSMVRGHYNQVFQAFDKDLFIFLAPPKTVAEVKRFDGSEVGNLVEIYFKFPINKMWISKITATNKGNKENYFIDEGIQLPLGLKFWKHKHIVRNKGANSLIIDDMEFKSHNKLLDYILYLLFIFAFAPRIILYKKYFNKQKITIS